MTNFVKIATFTYAHEFTVLRLLLDRAAISYFFENETALGVLPFYSNALGGIHLKVHPKDKIKALQIIDDLNTSSQLHIV